MKKIISLFLSLIMVISVAPMSFIAEAATTGHKVYNNRDYYDYYNLYNADSLLSKENASAIIAVLDVFEGYIGERYDAYDMLQNIDHDVYNAQTIDMSDLIDQVNVYSISKYGYRLNYEVIDNNINTIDSAMTSSTNVIIPVKKGTFSPNGVNAYIPLVNKSGSKYNIMRTTSKGTSFSAQTKTTISKALDTNGEVIKILSSEESLVSGSVVHGNRILYAYDLSATEEDNVMAYYMVPNENTTELEVEEEQNSGISGLIAPLMNILNFFKPITAYAAENTVTVNNVEYNLSDEDTLVIQGHGQMKENIQSELMDYNGFRDDVRQHFSSQITEVIKSDGLRMSLSGNVVGFTAARLEDDSCSYVLSFPEQGTNVTVFKKGELNEYYTNKYEGNWYELTADTTSSFYRQVVNYCNSIKSNYAISLPTEIIIKDGVTNVSTKAFYGADTIETVDIAGTVETINEDAFRGCTKLKTVSFSDGLKSIGSYAFNDCKQLREVILPNSVTSVSARAFYNCASVSKIKISNSMTVVEAKTFYGCKRDASVYIPSSITTIRSEAFRSGGISDYKNVYFDNIESFVNTNRDFLAFGSFVLYIDDELVTDLDIPNGITEVERGSCACCKSITSVTIPDSVTSIGQYAFSDCTGLTNITISDGVTSIGENAFDGCTGLTSITIPASVTSIGQYAFDDCTGLTSIVVDSGNANYSSQDGVLFNKNKTELIRYPMGNSRTSYTIPNSVTSIGGYAFDGCRGLTNVTIPNSVTNIGSYAFCNCWGLTSITIPNSVKSIGDSAFYGCKALTSVKIPSGVKSIADRAFQSMASGSTIYCQSQAVANLLSGKYTTSKTTVVVDPTQFA